MTLIVATGEKLYGGKCLNSRISESKMAFLKRKLRELKEKYIKKNRIIDVVITDGMVLKQLSSLNVNK